MSCLLYGRKSVLLEDAENIGVIRMMAGPGDQLAVFMDDGHISAGRIRHIIGNNRTAADGAFGIKRCHRNNGQL